VKTQIIVSFVHGYDEHKFTHDPNDLRPALWNVNEEKHYSYPFPRNPDDFIKYKNLIAGELPLKDARVFEKLPRFGFTGMVATNDHIFTGSWNAVYKIDRKNFELERIISNRLINDLHGIYADEEIIITALTCKDTVVISDHSGNVIEHFAIDKNLSVIQYDDIDKYDWRFISKQFRGSCGYWHFNYVQKIGNEIWLTARNISAFIVVDLNTRSASLRTMNMCTPVLIHDGKKVRDRYYFTSVDGKIIIAEDSKKAQNNDNHWEDPGDLELYNRDLIAKLIRISETEFGREPNWCRGIHVDGDVIYVTVDGRYDTDLSFAVVGIKESGEKVFEERLCWRDIGPEDELRYVTGFDLTCSNMKFP
jgi:hypothetical protein